MPAAVAASVMPNSSFLFTPSAPTFAGNSSAFLSGPTLVPFTASSPALLGSAAASGTSPSLNAKPYAGSVSPDNHKHSPVTIPPKVDCRTGAGGCLPVNTGNGGSSSTSAGINAYENRLTLQGLGAPYGTVEPPDKGLCSGNGFILESENVGEVQVFNSASLLPVSGVVSLDTLMGLTSLGWSSGGDIMCQYDYANGGHWFITQFVSTTPTTAGGPFVGCFAALLDGCREGIAVSVSNNPMGSYNVYFLDPNKVNSDPGVGYLLNDYAKTATTRDAFLLFYDEYNLIGGYNGVQQFAFGKNALENGLSPGSINVAYEDMGTNSNLAIPPNGVYQPSPLPPTAWYQVIPAQTTDPAQYDNSNGGTGLMITSLDFLGNGDNRTAAFDWTGLSALNSAGCSKCGNIAFGGELLTGRVTYQDEGAPCLAANYAIISTFCGLGAQKVGPIPLGTNCVARGLASGVITCPESGIATNGDGATQAFYSNGTIWTAVSTVVNETYNKFSAEYHLGATYWGVNVNNHGGVHFSIGTSGIVSASHEDLEFPTMASTTGAVLMAFTLSGNGGPTGANHGGFFPSTAFTMLGSGTIYISAMGKAPQDGFSEYQGYDPIYGILTTRPRWGDYNQAVFDPVAGKFFFATEMIPNPNCPNSMFLKDPTCGGTRSPNGNWGNSINGLPA